MKNVIIPDFVDYPELYDISSNIKLFSGVFVYVIDGYELVGYSLYIGFRENYSICRIADFKSNEFTDLSGRVPEMLLLSDKLKEVMIYARVSDALFYFSNNNGNEPILVDVMLSANKFVGPGMLRDLFGNIVKTQGVVETVVFEEDMLAKHKGKIIKPSRFRYLSENGMIRPQYGIIG